MLVIKFITFLTIIFLLRVVKIFTTPVKRLFFIPILYMTLSLFLNYLFIEEEFTILFIIILLFEGYILFQLINLANTSRRMEVLRNGEKANFLTNNERIDHLIKDGYLVKINQNKFEVRSNFYYEFLSKISILFKSIFR